MIKILIYDLYVFHKFRLIYPQNITFLCELLAQRLIMLIIKICLSYVKQLHYFQSFSHKYNNNDHRATNTKLTVSVINS